MAKTNKSAPPDYEVGRGKPPAATRFKPGQSGNPGGRKKGSRNFRTLVTDLLESEIELLENGKKSKACYIEALLKRLIQVGLHGDRRAINDLISLYERYSSATREEAVEELPEEDRALLFQWLDSRTLKFAGAAGEKEEDDE